MSLTPTQQAELSESFGPSQWPNVPQDLLDKLEAWVQAHLPVYKPGDSGDQALGALAHHGGMRYVVEGLRKVRKSQTDPKSATRISTQLSGE